MLNFQEEFLSFGGQGSIFMSAFKPQFAIIGLAILNIGQQIVFHGQTEFKHYHGRLSSIIK